MQTYQIEIDIQNTKNQMVSVTLLQALLSAIIEGSKGSLRLRAEGRSTIRGTPPKWVKASTQFALELKGTHLVIESPTLQEAAPELFQQTDLYPELVPNRTSLDYFHESLMAALNPEMEDSLYDRPLLEALQCFRYVFNQGADKIHFLKEKELQITPEIITAFRELEASMPVPCQTKLAGRIDSIRTQDRTFRLLPLKHNMGIKGIAKQITPKEAQALLGKDVLVSGTAYFTTSGKILRLEADQIVIAQDTDMESWSELPVPISSNLKSSENKGLPRTFANPTGHHWQKDKGHEEIAQRPSRLPEF
ncbi:hypothetical protein [Candidatus Parabeggiatoa sp. HSG14]|uniref:hypothetical protein n=1 Tax=Candidatus Parabeggiatoa sp. HSG14 TaxID=3055593 RepID=UPI0025A8650A|nr:hypothetical protein [Thiotrichales bacterium HSG14]